MHVLSLEKKEKFNITRVVVTTNQDLFCIIRERIFSLYLCRCHCTLLKMNVVQRNPTTSCKYMEIVNLSRESSYERSSIFHSADRLRLLFPILSSRSSFILYLKANTRYHMPNHFVQSCVTSNISFLLASSSPHSRFAYIPENTRPPATASQYCIKPLPMTDPLGKLLRITGHDTRPT